ncbi:MAG: acyl carrier protein [Pikeienuella sp.]
MVDDVAQTIIGIIAEQAMLNPDEIGLASSPQDLGLDSLGVVEVVFALEERFDISVPFNANEPGASEFDISSVGKIVDAVKHLIAAKA